MYRNLSHIIHYLTFSFSFSFPYKFPYFFTLLFQPGKFIFIEITLYRIFSTITIFRWESPIKNFYRFQNFQNILFLLFNLSKKVNFSEIFLCSFLPRRIIFIEIIVPDFLSLYSISTRKSLSWLLFIDHELFYFYWNRIVSDFLSRYFISARKSLMSFIVKNIYFYWNNIVSDFLYHYLILIFVKESILFIFCTLPTRRYFILIKIIL